MLFEKESDGAGYLGVSLCWDTDNDTITLRQPGLAQRIVEPLHLDDNTPPVEYLVDSNLPLEDRKLPQGLYNYTFVVDMLGYLQGYFCADIIFAISQVFVISLVQSVLKN